MTARPSFVMFVTDQHRADFLGCAGHPVLKTPNIDALAAAGVRHENFFVNSPVCMPNRASIMTCRPPSSHGVWTNGTPLSQRQVTFVELLRAAGYDTALIGKSHLQNFTGVDSTLGRVPAPEGQSPVPAEMAGAERSGFETPAYQQERPRHWASPDAAMALPFYGFDHVDLVTGHGDAAGGAYGRWLRAQRPDAASLLGADNQLAHDYSVPQAVRTRLPEELYTTSWITDRAVEWLEQRRDPARPFFLMVSWPDPHHPFNPPGRFWDMYRPEDMAIPEAFARDDWQPPAYVAAAIAAREAGTAQVKGFGAFACTAREAQEARALTCGMIAMIDEGVGKLNATLEAQGLTGETVRLFTSDHGDHLGDHRMMLKGVEMYDAILRVPMIWADPQGPQGQVETGIGQSQDIGTTILARARVQASFGMQGQVLPVAGGEPRPSVMVQFDNQHPVPTIGPMPRVHSLRDKRWRLSLFDGVARGELYDLASDPGEFVNLWDDPAHAADRAACIEALLRHEIAAADRLPLPMGPA